MPKKETYVECDIVKLLETVSEEVLEEFSEEMFGEDETVKEIFKLGAEHTIKLLEVTIAKIQEKQGENCVLVHRTGMEKVSVYEVNIQE